MTRALLMLLLFGAAIPARSEPFRKPLTDTSKNLHLLAWEATSADLTPNCPHAWSIRKLVLHGGKQEGVDLIEIDNGKLKLAIVPTRGMGILAAALGDVRLGWDSPIKEVVHPKFINLQARSGLGWLDGFNEWMCRCGLENNGQPGADKFITNTGAESTMELTLHGKIANIPASEVEVIVEREPPYRLHVRGRVHERMFHGPKLELLAEISTEPGSSTFRIADVVTNRGGTPQEFEMLYHANFGKPILEEGATLVAPVKRVTPFNDHAARALAHFDTFDAPTAGFVEQAYKFQLYSGDSDRTLVLLCNKARDKGASLAFSLKELPYFTLWKNAVAEVDGYVTGLEPATNYPNNRRVEREAGRVPKLTPGAGRAMTIDVGVHVGPDEVKRAADAVAAIQNGRATTRDDKP